MQIPTIEMILEMLKQVKEISGLLFESIITATWSSVVDSLATLPATILTHDWSSLVLGIFMVVSGVLLLYRIVRDNLMSTLEILLNK